MAKEAKSIGSCPHCGGEILHGKYGYYCAKKCGMCLGKVYGNVLTETQLNALLSGKQTTYMREGRTTLVLPEVEEDEYMGKIYYQWKTKKG